MVNPGLFLRITYSGTYLLFPVGLFILMHTYYSWQRIFFSNKIMKKCIILPVAFYIVR